MLDILAPAKLNLGLEITGRRDDGYHNLRTLFCTISLFDRLTISPAGCDSFHVDRPEFTEDNLVTRAVAIWDEAGLHRPKLRIRLRKRIPAAAGLGGASSDAASTLHALCRLSTSRVSQESLAEMALAIGSDVPFFLTGGIALADGRGEQLQVLSANPFAAVIIVPPIDIANKTALMFRSLVPSDFTDGSQLDAIVGQIGSIGRPEGNGFVNAFERPLYHLYPEMVVIARAIQAATNRNATISGAGPSMFLTVETMREAHRMRAQLRHISELSTCAIQAVKAVLVRGAIERKHD